MDKKDYRICVDCGGEFYAPTMPDDYVCGDCQREHEEEEHAAYEKELEAVQA